MIKRALVVSLVWGLVVAAPAHAAKVFFVNKTGDHAPGRCSHKDCTLREAIRAANTHAGRDVVVLKGGKTYKLTRAATPGENAALDGDLDVTGSLTIKRSGRRRAIVDGNHIDSVFQIFDPAEVSFIGIVVRNGNAPPSGGAGGIDGLSNGKLSLIHSKVKGNDGPYTGGVETGGRILVKRSAITGNHNTTNPSGVGGIEAFNGSGGGSASIIESSITHNTGAGDGGLYLAGGGRISRSRIAHNHGVGDVGGVDSGQILHITRSQIRRNVGKYVGGVYVGGGTRLSIAHSTIAGNTGTNDVGGVSAGGISFSMSRSSISGNHGLNGGIEFNLTGAGKISRSRVGGNVGTKNTGAGGIESGTPLTVVKSTVAGNHSAGPGGGIYSTGPLTVKASTISGNRTADDGGGLYQQPNNSATLINSTVAYNRADGSGGGIAVAGGGSETISLNAVTIARNVAEANGSGMDVGGGIYKEISPVSVENSLIALNTVGATGLAPDCYTALVFPYTSGGHNLRTTDDVNCPGFSASGDIVRSHPRIGKLADNGGPTKTVALLRHSPAVNRAGSDAPPRDQRGVKRHDPDIGAFERA